MGRAKASGEQDAVRGYGYQYDHVAATAYDLYRARRHFTLRLVDPEVGAVDDCVLVLAPVTAGAGPEVHGYQYKSAAGNLTLAGLLAAEKTKKGEPKLSLLAELLDGWRKLSAHYGGHEVVVHLVTPGAPSRHDRPLTAALKAVGGAVLPAPSRQHTAAFVESVLQPLASGGRLQDVDPAWKPVLEWICGQVGMKEGEVEPFLAALRIDADTAAAMPARPDRLPPEQRSEDIGHLAAVLHRRVQDSEAGEAVVLTPDDVAALAGFGSRGRLRHLHRFPIDLDRYTPLVGAEQALARALESAPSGYLCVLGPPGSGKSTLLAHATPGLADRVVTYLAFLPGDAAAAGRVSATDFLHDVVVQLEASQLKVRKSLPERDVNELRLRFRDLLSAASAEFEQTGRRTLLIVDGLDHVARARVSQPLLDELPAPEAVPDGVVIVLGSQTLAPLNPKIQHHLGGALKDSTRRTVDLAAHRLTPAAVEGACHRLAEAVPALALTNSQIARVVQLVGGHPLALAYVTNALIDLIDEQALVDEADVAGSMQIPAGAVDDALDRCVRYSGSVANDYAAYLADLPDSDALQALLGDLARLRSPINMRWVQKWADSSALRSLVRLKHLFRILDRHSWMFFHDSFRQFVLEATSVDLLGEPDPDADARRHALLADECAAAQEGSRENGEEFFHAAQAGQQRRALALATPDRLRARFLAGTSPAVLTEDIRTAMRLAAEETDAGALVGLVLVHAELQSREQALESVDLTGMLIDAGDLNAAISYALPNATLRIPIQQALTAAVKLDDLGHPAGRLLFDAADVHELGPVGGSEQWETLSAWATGTVRFRPLPVLETVLRRMSERALLRLTATSEGYRDHAAFALGGHAVYFMRCAVSELLRTGRLVDAEGLTAKLRAGASKLLTAIPAEDTSERTWGHELIEAAYDAVADASIQTARARAKAGQWDEALETLQNLTTPPVNGSDVEQRALAAMSRRFGGEAAWIALQIAAKAAQQAARTPTANGPEAATATDATNAQHMTALAAAAFAFGTNQLRRLDAPTSIASGDLSGIVDQSGVLGPALRVRTSHLIIAGLSARSTGQTVTEDLLLAATPALRQQPPNQPAGAQIDPTAAAHRDRAAISYATQLNRAVTNLALLNAAVILGDLPAGALRGLASRSVASMPSVPDSRSVRTSERKAHITLLKMLIDVSSRGSADLVRYVGERIGELGGGSAPRGKPAGAADDRTFNARQRQGLGLHILQHGVRVSWLGDAIADADGELQYAPGAYERLDLLLTQAAAHLQAGETAAGRALLARVMPESFSPHWRKDIQLEIWVNWLVRATQGRADALLAEAVDLAPLIAALTEATDGSAEAAAEVLLQEVARVAPRHAVRLAAWQLREGSLALTAAHEALAAGIAANILDAVMRNPDDIEAHHAATLLSAVVATVLAPLCPTAPADVLRPIGNLLPRLPAPVAATITEQLTRAVDVHVLASARRDWRRALRLLATPTSRCDEADEETSQRSRPTGRASSRNWGASEYGLFKHADGSTSTPEAVREAISDLNAALSWRSLQAEPGTFSWLPIVQPLIARADRQQLDQLVRAFDGAHDEAAILVAIAERLKEIQGCDGAAAIARIALGKSEPEWWDAHHMHGTRRRAWQALTACEGQPARKDAMRDLAQVLTSADYWPGNLMLQLDDILPVIAPDLSADAVWNQVRQYLKVMGTGVHESHRPVLDEPIYAAWWAPQSEANPVTTTRQESYPLLPHSDQADVPLSTPAARALVEMLFIDLDHPTWVVREAACAALAWLLTQTNSLADEAATLAALLLASQDHQPVLVPPITGTSSDDASPPPTTSAADEPSESAGIGGDAVREVAARAVASAAAITGRQEPLVSCVPSQGSRSWLVTDSLRRAFPIDLIATPTRPLPAAYRLTLPQSSQIREPDVEMGPYAEKVQEIVLHADLDPETLLHRLSWLADRAQRHTPDDQTLQRAAKGTSITGMLIPPWAQAVRAAFGRIISELVAARQIQPGAPELAAALELVDIDLVSQPFTATPTWIPVPILRDWIPAEQWLSETNDRLAQYEAGLAGIHMAVADNDATNRIALTSSLLEPLATIDIDPIAVVIGADHEFVINDEGNPTERYLLSTTFDQVQELPAARPSGIVLPPDPTPTIRMIKARDWLLADGVRPSTSGSGPRHSTSWAGKPLLVWTTSLALHTNAATWLCLNPDVANAHQWQPHPRYPLCWQDTSGAIMAATLLWRRSSTGIRHGLHEAAGQGSAVVLTDAGLTTLTKTAAIRRTHQVTRSVRRSEYDGPPEEGRQSAIAVLTTNRRERPRSERP